MKADHHFCGDSILLEKIQGLSLDQLEIGRLIGKGCNAAVHEARLKTVDTGNSRVKNDKFVNFIFSSENSIFRFLIGSLPMVIHEKYMDCLLPQTKLITD